AVDAANIRRSAFIVRPRMPDVGDETNGTSREVLRTSVSCPHFRLCIWQIRELPRAPITTGRTSNPVPFTRIQESVLDGLPKPSLRIPASNCPEASAILSVPVQTER